MSKPCEKCNGEGTDFELEDIYTGNCLECNGEGEIETRSLPRIVRFLGTDDSPDSTCPHCGATGRYIHRFFTDDGRTLAAMSGCVKLFPVSRVATEEARLLKKQTDYAKRGWHLNRNDQHALDQINRYYAKEIDERSALSSVDLAKRSNQARYRR